MLVEIGWVLLSNVAAVGGLLWVFLEFGFKRKLDEMKSVHEAELKLQHLQHESAAKIQHANHEAQLKQIQAQLDSSLVEISHARKAVFTRYDDKRAAAILKMESALFSFTWASINLTMPTFKDEPPPVVVFMTRAMELNALANQAMQISGENAFFFSGEFKVKLSVLWYPSARAYARAVLNVGIELSQMESFKSADNNTQSNMIREKLEKDTSELSSAVSTARGTLSTQLERWFKESTPLSSEDYQLSRSPSSESNKSS